MWAGNINYKFFLVIITFILSSCQPMATVLPTPSPTSIFESFLSHTVEEVGFSLKYPNDWIVTDDMQAVDLPSGNAFEFTAIMIASDPGLKRSDVASFQNGQGYMVLNFMDGKGISLPPENLPDILNHGLIYRPPDKEAAKMITLNGQQFAIAAYDVTNKGIPYPNFVAATSFGDKVVYAYVFTSAGNEGDFRILFEKVLTSIEYSGN